MTDVDRMTDHETRLREELHRTLVPPPTPASLRQAVEAMATEEVASPDPPRRPWRAALGLGARGLRLAVGAVAVVGLAAVALVVLQARGDVGIVGATPRPTLPAITGPVLPSPAGTPTRLEAAAWLDGRTAWARELGTNAIRFSTDGGLSWSEARRLPIADNDATLDVLDGDHATMLEIETLPSGDRAASAWLTSDGGRTWVERSIATLPEARGVSDSVTLHFADPQHGVLLATTLDQPADGADWAEPVECAGWTTDDGGRTWDDVAPAPCLGHSVAWYGATLGVAWLGPTRLAATTDGGRTWTEGAVPVPNAATALWTRAAIQPMDGPLRLVGAFMPADGVAVPPIPLIVLESPDGGATWHEAYRSDAVDMIDVRAITAFDADHWLATARSDTEDPMVHGSRFLETTDGGQTWTEVGRVRIDTGGGVHWADRLHGTIQGGRMVRAADGSGEDYITVWLTNDGGATWHEVPF